MRFPIHKVVDLHQIQLLCAHLLKGGLHLRDAFVFSVGPYLGREKETLVPSKFLTELTHDSLCTPVHGGGVDNCAAMLLEKSQDLKALLKGFGVRFDIECLPSAKPDGREGFLGLGDLSGKERGRGCMRKAL